MKIFKVLQIDAWAEGEESWTWNNWYHVDSFNEEEEGELTEKNALRFFFYSLGYKGPFHKFHALYEIYDDQHNLVLMEKKNGMPLYAIEYGNIE